MRKHALLHGRAVLHQQAGIAHREQAATDADRGHGKKTVGSRLDRIGQLHAAEFVVLSRRQHARLDVGLMRIVRGLRQDHAQAAIGRGFGARLLRVHQAVERGVLVAGDSFTGVEHRVEGVARMVGKTLTLAQAVRLQPVVEQEVNGRTMAHGDIPGLEKKNGRWAGILACPRPMVMFKVWP